MELVITTVEQPTQFTSCKPPLPAHHFLNVDIRLKHQVKACSLLKVHQKLSKSRR